MTAEEHPVAPLDHASARARFGQPDEWIGSVNDPRTHEEHGIRYNERWTYFLPDGSKRHVYWHRYGFRGIRRESPDGEIFPESLQSLGS